MQTYTNLGFFNRGGLRIFFTFNGDEIVILLSAGDKDSQSDDIKKTKEILKDYKWKKNLQNLI